jgi:thioredoxin 1
MATVTGTSENFDEELAVDIPVVVDFWAEWCGPCKALSPALETLSEKFEGSVKVVKIDVMNNQDLAKKFNISSIPYLGIFKGGKLVDSQVGFSGAEALETLFENLSK